jgi:hypothetical protein
MASKEFRHPEPNEFRHPDPKEFGHPEFCGAAGVSIPRDSDIQTFVGDWS